MKKIFFILFTLQFSLITQAQPSITWNRLYEGGYNQNDGFGGICKTTDGNYVLGGITTFHDAMILKIDVYGNTVWLKHFNVNGCEAITSTNDGGVVFASPFLTKLNFNGDTLWTRQYLQQNITNLNDIIQCSDGGYFTCGRAYYDSGYVMKTDIQGNFQWKQMITDPSLTVRLYAVCEAYSNGYIVAGRKYGINENKSILGRYGYNGEKIWVKVFGEGDSLGSGKRIIKQPPYYVVSCVSGYMKIDDQGNVISAKLIPNDTNYAYPIVDMQFMTNDKFVIVTNNTSFVGQCYTKICTLDTNGNIFNSRSVLFSDFIRLKKVLLESNGDIVFGGDAARYDTSRLDFYALRTDSNLNFPPIGIRNISEQIPSQFYLYQNYPNPFNPTAKIKFNIPLPSEGAAGRGVLVKLTIYDILGREVQTLVNHELKHGTYEVEFNGSGFASGLYFYKLKAGDYSETKKMVLVK